VQTKAVRLIEYFDGRKQSIIPLYQRYNGELGNKSFAEKREIYAVSHFEINKTIASEMAWDIASIARRGEALAKMAISVWAGPLPASDAS
jgi:hypothetical protein